MPDGVMYRCEPTAASVQTALGDVIENYHSLHPRPASDVTQAYDNINVAKRTLAVYEAAMAASQKTGAMEYVMKGQTWMERFNIAIILVIETIMLFVLDWFDPPKEVERAIDYSDVWRQRIDCSR